MAVSIQALPVFINDGGNAFDKYVAGHIEGFFVHAIAELSPAQYDNAIDRYGKTAPLDFLKIDGRYYAVGETAENFEVARRSGRTKYQRDYYGLLFASAIARAFINQPEFLSNGIRVMASHASDDHQFRKILQDAIKGRWKFNCAGVDFNFRVESVQTFEEPFGGYARRAFIKDKRGRWTTPLHGLSVGVIDIGGGTCGVLAVNEEGVVQHSRAKSGTMGVNNALKRLEMELQNKYLDFFNQTRKIDPKRLRAALSSGVYKGKGRELPCADLVELAVSGLLNEVQSLYLENLGGGTGMDVMVLTGGGNGLLHERVTRLLDHDDVILADELDSIHYANVRGAAAFDEVLEAYL